METKISVSVLGCDFSDIRSEFNKINESGADMIHLDIMDGDFVPNISFGLPVAFAMRKCSDKFFDVHLMISHPFEYIDNFSKAGADLITFHAESKSNIQDTINKIKNNKVKVGLSVKPATDIKSITNYLPSLDLVLVMTVEPGFGGQKFMENQMEKVELLKKYREENGLDYEIEVDGGINDKTYKKAVKAGSDILVAGSFLTNSKDMKTSVNILKGRE